MVYSNCGRYKAILQHFFPSSSDININIYPVPYLTRRRVSQLVSQSVISLPLRHHLSTLTCYLSYHQLSPVPFSTMHKPTLKVHYYHNFFSPLDVSYQWIEDLVASQFYLSVCVCLSFSAFAFTMSILVCLQICLSVLKICLSVCLLLTQKDHKKHSTSSEYILHVKNDPSRHMH